MTTYRIKDVACINSRVLPESTDPDFRFKYIDIGAVDGLGNIAVPEEQVSFGSAPSRARRLAAPGDTIVSTVRTYLRAVATVPATDDPLIFSTGFAVLQAKDIEGRFLSYYCQSQPFIDEVVTRSNGVSYPAINASEIGNISVPVPSIDEQRRIADFLDAETARIDFLIDKKRKMIALLDERVQAVINQITPGAMVHGLDGRPVGIAGVKSIRLGAVAVVQGGFTMDGGRKNGADSVTLPYLRVANVLDGSLALQDIKEVTLPKSLAKRCTLRPGDVLMTEGGDPDKLGRGTVWSGEIEPCLHQNAIFAVRPDSRLLPEYLALVTRTQYARVYFEITASKSTGIAHTSSTKITGFRVPMLAVSEQGRMVRLVNESLAKIDALRGLVERQVSLLAERRQALITAAVTGQIDVTTARGADAS